MKNEKQIAKEYIQSKNIKINKVSWGIYSFRYNHKTITLEKIMCIKEKKWKWKHSLGNELFEDMNLAAYSVIKNYL